MSRAPQGSTQLGYGMLHWKAAALAVALAAIPVAISCSGAGDNRQFNAGGSGGSTSDSMTTAMGGGSGIGGSIITAVGGGMPGSAVVVQPANPTLKVTIPTMKPSTIQFKCIDTKTNNPALGATWTLDTPSIGSIDPTGLFTASGAQAGPVKITCTANGQAGDTTLNVLIHAIDDMGGVGQNDKMTLQGPPGQGDASWQFLYPYDKTVFPRGTVPPEIQLTDGSAPGTAFYVHIVTKNFEYEGFWATGSPVRLLMSQAAWDALTNSAGGQDVDVQVSKMASGAKFGPIFRTWTLAPGKLHGVVYYNTYTSPLAGNTGAMMRIKGTSVMPEVLVGNCTVCHSISSDGSTAAAANHAGGPSGIYDLSGGMLNPPIIYAIDEIAAFAGLYPDGSYWVVNAEPNWGSTPGSWGGYTSSLRAKLGATIANSGIEQYYAQSPCFSHDGTKIAFLDRATGQSYALAIMDFDKNTQKFSNYQILAPGQNSRYNAWPAFTPDNKYVLFQSGTGGDLATWGGNMGKIYAVDTVGKQVVYLSVLNGDGYVPQGQRDLDLNFEPTTSPIASGGYFWVMFTSRRTYGNRLTGTRDQTKVLWASALDINPKAGQDFSHPAFYIPGQELTSGNSRGFWALDACKPDGQDCQTGDECCNGFCEPKGNPPQYVCGPPNGMCSHEFENCMTDGDCCDPTLQCIGGKCTYIPPK